MLITEKYTNMRDRQEKVNKRESEGLRMSYDNFDIDWKPGDEPHGVMGFTNEPQLVVNESPVRDVLKEIDALKAEIEKLKMAEVDKA